MPTPCASVSARASGRVTSRRARRVARRTPCRVGLDERLLVLLRHRPGAVGRRGELGSRADALAGTGCTRCSHLKFVDTDSGRARTALVVPVRRRVTSGLRASLDVLHRRRRPRPGGGCLAGPPRLARGRPACGWTAMSEADRERSELSHVGHCRRRAHGRRRRKPPLRRRAVARATVRMAPKERRSVCGHCRKATRSSPRSSPASSQRSGRAS